MGEEAIGGDRDDEGPDVEDGDDREEHENGKEID
jgi:hypothetical protein